MSGRALSVASQALQAVGGVGIPLTDTLIDGQQLGSFWVRVGVTVGTTDTNVAIKLARKPSCYLVVRSSNGAGVFDGTTPANWTGANITLRATASTVVSLLIG